MLTLKSLKQRKIVEILTLSESRVYWNEESANFGDHSWDFVLLSGDREIHSKNWSIPDYPGELTALTIFTSPTLETGTAILSVHPSHLKVQPLAMQREYLNFAVIVRPWVLVRPRESDPRPPRSVDSWANPAAVNLQLVYYKRIQIPNRLHTSKINPGRLSNDNNGTFIKAIDTFLIAIRARPRRCSKGGGGGITLYGGRNQTTTNFCWVRSLWIQLQGNSPIFAILSVSRQRRTSLKNANSFLYWLAFFILVGFCTLCLAFFRAF